MKLLVKMYGGSKMYGLNTPSSDTDILGVFLPELDDLILERAPKFMKSSTGSDNDRNNKEDVDTTYYSLNYFLKLLEQGQTVALEMLCVKKDDLLVCTPEWEYLMEHRKDFFTKNMKAFLGYCKSQAQIYSRKGDRIKLGNYILDVMKKNRKGDITNCIGSTVESVLNKEFSLDYLQSTYGKKNIFIEYPSTSTIPLLSVCGRKFQFTLSDSNFMRGISSILDGYGKRAEEVAKGTMDSKAVSHAFRVLEECKEIALTGDLQLPLRNNRDFILQVKLGLVDAGYCFDLLGRMLCEVEELISKSNLPNKVDMNPYRQFVLDIYYGNLIGGLNYVCD